MNRTRDGGSPAVARGPHARAGSRARCRVCRGELRLLHRGVGFAITSDALAPSRHEPGRHLDLLRCVECGVVQQMAAPLGEALLRLYRATRDDAYLDDEPGRRATAMRLLGLIGAHVSAGRLLDVGCGPGLLLDEARRRGYEPVGLELSRAAVRHARDSLGVDVRDVPLETFDDPAGFDVVVLADVLEHLGDPVAGLEQAVRLLRPGGVLCVTTPDPSSWTARLAGGRWWGYLPAHVCLLPRRVLRELLAAQGLVVCTDVPLVRTLRARRWVHGLAGRLGVLRTPVEAMARRLPDDLSISLSLRDEPIVLARRVEPRRAPKPLLGDRGAAAHVTVVLPAYNAVRTIPAVVAELPADAADQALLVDDGGTDATTEVALAHGFDALRHPVNVGYGASQKSGYVHALRDGADIVVMVHADNQYAPGLVADMVAPILAGEADMVLGSRLLDDRAVTGGMPRWKWIGNRLLSALENRAFDARLSEYHTGYRAFSAELLRSIAFLRNSDGFVFDQEIVAQVLASGSRVTEIAIPTRYFQEASSIGLGTSVRYGVATLGVLVRFTCDRRRGTWPLLRRPAARIGRAGACARKDPKPDFAQRLP